MFRLIYQTLGPDWDRRVLLPGGTELQYIANDAAIRIVGSSGTHAVNLRECGLPPLNPAATVLGTLVDGSAVLVFCSLIDRAYVLRLARHEMEVVFHPAVSVELVSTVDGPRIADLESEFEVQFDWMLRVRRTTDGIESMRVVRMTQVCESRASELQPSPTNRVQVHSFGTLDHGVLLVRNGVAVELDGEAASLTVSWRNRSVRLPLDEAHLVFRTFYSLAGVDAIVGWGGGRREIVCVWRWRAEIVEQYALPNNYNDIHSLTLVREQVVCWAWGPAVVYAEGVLAFDWHWNLRWEFHELPSVSGLEVRVEEDRVGFWDSSQIVLEDIWWLDAETGEVTVSAVH